MNFILAAAAFFADASVVRLDLYQVFKASPLIYLILIGLSLLSFVIWLYSLLTLKLARVIPTDFLNEIRGLLLEKRYDEALQSCLQTPHYAASVLAAAIAARPHGHQVVVETMRNEGKRCGVALWQRISVLNDVTVVAPMLGLLGTVLGLFYAFYDVNRTADTLASIFDGLGIAVGTTVAGLIVAIFAMIFYAILKFRIIRLLNNLERETLILGNLIEQ